MYELKIKNSTGGDAGDFTVDPSTLGKQIRNRLMHQACVMYAANKRQGTHKTKTRGEIQSTSKKPWRQKGTGRARAGTRRSPIWRGGGTTFGPQPRDYSYRLPKKALRGATQSALHSKLRDAETIVVEGFPTSGKTKDAATFLKAIGVAGRVLFVTLERDDTLNLAIRNLRNVTLLTVADLNAYELLINKQLVITKSGLDKAIEVYGAAIGKEA